jgi:hypothetical protein
LTFQLDPPDSAEANDIAHNALFSVVANKNSVVAEFKIRLGFHEAVSKTMVNVARPMRFRPAPAMVNEMETMRPESRPLRREKSRAFFLPKAEISVTHFLWSNKDGRQGRWGMLSALPRRRRESLI